MDENDTGRALVRWAGVASALGGACWVIKGMAILVTGDQPRLLFEIAPFFFLVGLMGLRVRLGHTGGRIATAGTVALLLAASLSVVTWLLSPDGSRPAGSSDEEFMPTLFLAFLALLTGMTLLGLVTRRTGALGDRWSNVPLGLVVAAPVVGVAGGIFESIDERLLEIPLVLYGFGWMVLGYALIRSSKDPSYNRRNSWEP